MFRMREGDFTARETNTIEYHLEFYYDMSRPGYIQYELTSYELPLKLRDNYDLLMREGVICNE